MNKENTKTNEQSTTFSKEDWENFFDMIEHPPEPTERFKKAAKKYNEIINPQNNEDDLDENLVQLMDIKI